MRALSNQPIQEVFMPDSILHLPRARLRPRTRRNSKEAVKPTMSRINELLEYNQETGVFHWLKTRKGVSNPNKFGSINSAGYRVVSIDGKFLYAHQIAVFIINGEWPTEDVDHINGVKCDNRRENLRVVSCSVNLQNLKRARSDNKSGFLGVAVHKFGFTAQINLNGKKRHIGIFKTAEAAHEAYLKVKREIHEGCEL